MSTNDLYLEIFREALSKQDIRVEFPTLAGVDLK